MALMKWYDEDDDKDESGRQRIASVQSGWQPAPSGANSAVATDGMTNRPSSGQSQPRQSYLLSEEKAQVDQQKRVRDAQVAEARRQAAAQAAYVASQQQAQQQQKQQQQQAVDPRIAQAKQERERRLRELQAQKEQENKGLSGFFNRNIRDRFDANTTQDRINRLSNEMPEMFQDEQKLTARDNVQSVATNPFNRILQDTTEWTRRVGSGGYQATGLADRERESYEKKHKAEDEAIAKAQAKIQDPSVSDEERLRWYNWLVKAAPEIAQSRYEDEIQMTKDAKDGDGVAVAGALAEGALDIATLGMGGLVFKGGKAAAKEGFKPLLKYAGKNIVKPALPAAGSGGLGAVTSQGRDVTPEQIAMGTAAGAGFGLGFGALSPLAGGLAGRGARSLTPDLLPAPTRANDGAVIPSVEPTTTPGFSPVRTDVAESASLPTIGDVPRINTKDVNFTPVGRENETTPVNRQPVVDRSMNIEPDSSLESMFRSESPNRYGVGQAENGSGLYVGSKDLAGRTTDGKIVTDGLYEYKVNPDAKLLDTKSDVYNKIDAEASNDPSLAGLDGRAWQKRKADIIAQKVKEQGYEGVRRGNNQVVAMSDNVLTPVTKDAPTYQPAVPEQVKALQDSRVGKSQADEAVINQKLQELDPDSPAIKGELDVDKSASLSKADVKRLRKQYQKAYDVETNPKRRRQISKAIAELNVDKSESITDKSKYRANLQSENPQTLVKNDGWESYRQTSIDRYEEYLRTVYNESHREGVKQSIKALRDSNPNEVYRINPQTGKVEVHPASELLGAFSKYIDDDVPPIVIGNVAEPGSMRRLPSNWDGAHGTYTSRLSRLDYKTKNSVYHETMHHIDHFIRGYEGDNPKMAELRGLRDAITVEDMQKFKAKEWRADKKAEYVAHAMDGLLDGRIKAGELGESVMKYIKKFFGSVKEAFTSSHIANRAHSKAEVAEYVQRLDAIINDGKAPNQKPLPPGELKPTTGNLPPSMGGGTKVPVTGGDSPIPKVNTPPKPKGFERMMIKSGDPVGAKQRIAEAVGLGKDGSSELAEILAKSGLGTKQIKKITDIYTEIEQIAGRNAAYQKQNRKNYVGKKDVDEGINKARNRDTRRAQLLQQQLETQLRKVKRQGSIGERITQIIENITTGRLANMLSSTGNVTRNLTQEIGADLISVLKNPIKTYRGATKGGNLVKNETRRSIDGWKNLPTTVSEGYKYILGNTYKTAMTPVSVGQRARVGAMRTELTKWAMKEIEGRNLTNAQAEKLSRTLSNHTEAMANTLAGIDNGMVSSRQAMKAMKAWKEFVKTGETSDLLKFEKLVERQTTLANKMLKGIFEGDSKKGRVLAALLNNTFPYVRTAWNLASTGTTRNLNPISKSVIDQIRADQLGKGTNTINIVKNKLVDYGILTGAAMLVNDNIIVYNDGDEVDKPRGISLNIPGSDTYIPIRATPIELPLAVVVAAARIAGDVASGDTRSPSYYGKIVSGSLPYIDAFEETTNTIDSVGSVIDGNDEGDGGYAAKAYGVNAAKSLVPWSNTGIEPQIDAIQGKSTDAKRVYDKDVGTWFTNSLKNSYGMGGDLEVSRDAAGRARTKDNQGVLINKTINDERTSEFNDRVSDLVKYGRQNGFGNATKDMFNTYDTGENNNFRSLMGTITFLDAPEVDGKPKPDNATKLEKNPKLADLSQQIRNGFYSDTGSELLTLDGQNLWSDVSMPTSTGTRNSSKPINMQSITNAIAATGLSREDNERMYEISQQVNGLYEKVKSKEMTYEQYQAGRAEIEEEYAAILSSSETYQELSNLMEELDSSGFFEADGLGATRSGQTYLWNALNALLASKGKTPAADYPKDEKSGWGSGGGGRGRGLSNAKSGGRGAQGVKWTPVQARQMAKVKKGTYTPFKATVRLGNAVKKDKTQNYASRSF